MTLIFWSSFLSLLSARITGCATILGLCSVRDQTQDCVHATQVPYLLSYIPSPWRFIIITTTTTTTITTWRLRVLKYTHSRACVLFFLCILPPRMYVHHVHSLVPKEARRGSWIPPSSNWSYKWEMAWTSPLTPESVLQPRNLYSLQMAIKATVLFLSPLRNWDGGLCSNRQLTKYGIW